MRDSKLAADLERIVPLERAHRVLPSLFPEARAPRTRVLAVDRDVFRLRVAPDCLTFCCSFRARPDAPVPDACCSWGVDADVLERDRIEAARDRVAPHLDAGARAAPWFRRSAVHDDDFPSGVAFSTRVRRGACVFLRCEGGRRGCGLHAAALADGGSPHALKPIFCSLFPLLIERGVLTHVRGDLDELTCSRTGPSVYRAQREALRALFGAALVEEIDALEKAAMGAGSA